MTPEQIQLVRLTFAQVATNEMEAGRLFYDRLFKIAPDTRALFKPDIKSQAGKLMNSLAIAISNLRNPGGLDYILEGLGRRHAKYGVCDRHYDQVGEALLWTLEKRLGDAFTADAKTAWSVLYLEVSEAMKKAAAGAVRKMAVG